MTYLTALTTPFGLLDRKTQEALKAHGGPLQILNYHGVWETIPLGLHWQANSTYRVKPTPPKPREWYISGGNCIWDTYAEAYTACDRGEKPIHVREVLPSTPTQGD